MGTRQPQQEEIEEAVIISGARKGLLIRLTDGEPELSSAEEKLLDELIDSARRLAESARAATAEAEALLSELREARRK
jgi:hypothetical protein